MSEKFPKLKLEDLRSFGVDWGRELVTPLSPASMSDFMKEVGIGPNADSRARLSVGCILHHSPTPRQYVNHRDPFSTFSVELKWNTEKNQYFLHLYADGREFDSESLRKVKEHFREYAEPDKDFFTIPIEAWALMLDDFDRMIEEHEQG